MLQDPHARRPDRRPRRHALGRLPSTIVIDHMGRVPLADCTSREAFKVIRELIEQLAESWVKLSGAYRDTRRSARRATADATHLAQRALQT